MIEIYKCNCPECLKNGDYAVGIKGEGMAINSGGYSDIEALLDNVTELIITHKKNKQRIK